MVKVKKPIGTRYKRPKYRNKSRTRILSQPKITDESSLAHDNNFEFQLFKPNNKLPRLKSARVKTPEEDNIQLSIEDDFPVNNNRSASASASASASFNSKSQQYLIREELEDRGAMLSMADDMMERKNCLSNIPNYPLTSRHVEMPSLMQISLNMNNIRTKIRETRAICESNKGTHLPVCVASAFSVLGLMLPEDLMREIEIQREQPIGRTNEEILNYLYTKNIITSKTMLNFDNEADLISKMQILLKKGNATIISVYGGNQPFSHVVLIVNDGHSIDRNNNHKSGLYCVDILTNVIFELDAKTNAFYNYLSNYGRNTNSIIVYNGDTINEKRGVKREINKESPKIRKREERLSKKRRLEGGQKSRKTFSYKD